MFLANATRFGIFVAFCDTIMKDNNMYHLLQNDQRVAQQDHRCFIVAYT
jgi:hypothetical protein